VCVCVFDKRIPACHCFSALVCCCGNKPCMSRLRNDYPITINPFIILFIIPSEKVTWRATFLACVYVCVPESSTRLATVITPVDRCQQQPTFSIPPNKHFYHSLLVHSIFFWLENRQLLAWCHFRRMYVPDVGEVGAVKKAEKI